MAVTERAVLVGVDLPGRGFASQASSQRLSARQARAGADAAAQPPAADAAELSPALARIAESVASHDELLAEFRELVRSAGAEIVAEVVQRRQRPDPATLFGAGKLEEIRGIVSSCQADLVLVDHELTPTQFRNLEDRLECRVLDRTQLILDIFAGHARTREGQLQVECAQLEYQLPRLAGRGRSMSQLGGGIGTRGPGETQLETDRRKIQRRLVHLRTQLEAVRRVRRQQRQRREAVPVPTVALVGYTNAGKSSLFNRLTGAQVLSSSRMFATLDPKLRAIELPSRRRILLSDTVGFIRNLPHMLVSSFCATLEEVERAEILLHIRDAASESFREQKEQVERVLGELNALQIPRIEVLNKADLLDPEQVEAGASAGAVYVSAHTGFGLERLLLAIDEALTADPMIESEMCLSQSDGATLAALEAGAVILHREYFMDQVRIRMRAPASLLGRFAKTHPDARSAEIHTSCSAKTSRKSSKK